MRRFLRAERAPVGASAPIHNRNFRMSHRPEQVAGERQVAPAGPRIIHGRETSSPPQRSTAGRAAGRRFSASASRCSSRQAIGARLIERRGHSGLGGPQISKIDTRLSRRPATRLDSARGSQRPGFWSRNSWRRLSVDRQSRTSGKKSGKIRFITFTNSATGDQIPDRQCRKGQTSPQRDHPAPAGTRSKRAPRLGKFFRIKHSDLLCFARELERPV